MALSKVVNNSIESVDAAKLTGTLPAISGANLTNMAAGGAWNFISSITASSSTSVNFENVFDSTYDLYMITGSTIIPSQDGTRLEWQAGTGSTPTFVTSGYEYTNGSVRSNAPGYAGITNSESDTLGTIANHVGAGTGEAAYFEHKIFKPSDTTKYKCFSGTATLFNEFGQAEHGMHVGNLSTTTAVTSIKYFCENGTITSGTFRLYGLANS